MPFRQAETYAVHRLDVVDRALEQAFFDREPDFQVLDFKQRSTCGVGRRTAAGLGAEQHFGVRMLRRTEQFFARCLFDDATALHDTYSVGYLPYDVQIVADKQQCHTQASLQLLEQFEDLQLYRHIQRGGRFIGNQQLGFVGQGHGDHHALTLAT